MSEQPVDKKKGKTSSLSDSKAPSVAPSFAPSSLLLQGYGVEYPLELDTMEWLLGTHLRASIRIDLPYVSEQHCRIKRDGFRLRITDGSVINGVVAPSTNGTKFGGLIQSEFWVGAGDVFYVANHALIVLNEAMRTARRTMTLALGFAAHTAVDTLLVAAWESDPIHFFGARQNDDEHLARTIHIMSPRSNRPFIPVTQPVAPRTEGHIVRSAKGGTLFLDLDKIGPVGDPLASCVQAALPNQPNTYDVRLITTASEKGQFAFAFPHVALPVAPVQLPPVGLRPGEICWLLSEAARDHGLTLHRHELGEKNELALRRWDWPENMTELRQAAQDLVALIATRGAVKTAADRTGRKRETLRDWIARVGIDVDFWKKK